MAKIIQMRDEGIEAYPITKPECVIDENGKTLKDTMEGWMPATPSGDPMHYMYEAVGATYNATDVDIPMVGIYGDSYVHKARHWHLNELGDITNEEMRAIYSADIGDGLSWNRMLAFYPFRTHKRFYYYGISSDYSQFKDSSILNGLVGSKLVVFVMPPIINNAIPNFNSPTSFAYSCAKLEKILNPFRFQIAPGSAAFLATSKLKEIRLHSVAWGLSFKSCPDLSNASILYMIQNEIATTAIVITLHADAYARAMADEAITTALEAHPNVSLASA